MLPAHEREPLTTEASEGTGSKVSRGRWPFRGASLVTVWLFECLPLLCHVEVISGESGIGDMTGSKGIVPAGYPFGGGSS